MQPLGDEVQSPTNKQVMMQNKMNKLSTNHQNIKSLKDLEEISDDDNLNSERATASIFCAQCAPARSAEISA